MSCPFYGCALHALHQVVIVTMTNGNQCALITPHAAPCRMELEGAAPEWKDCPRNPMINGSCVVVLKEKWEPEPTQ